MILANEGVSMTQLEIAKRILDVQFLENGIDFQITGFEIEKFLNDLKFEINGVIYQLNVNEYADLQIYEKIILNELKRNKPILTSYNKLSSSIADDKLWSRCCYFWGQLFGIGRC